MAKKRGRIGPWGETLYSLREVGDWWNNTEESGRAFLMRRISHFMKGEEVSVSYAQLDSYIDRSWSRLPGFMKTLVKWMMED